MCAAADMALADQLKKLKFSEDVSKVPTLLFSQVHTRPITLQRRRPPRRHHV